MRAYGTLRVFANKKTINLHKVLRVESVDEITHHLLSVISTHLMLTKPKPKSKLGMSLDGANLAMFNQSVYAQPQFQQQANAGGFSGIQSQIMTFFHQTIDTTTGGSIVDLLHRLRGSASEQSIRFY